MTLRRVDKVKRHRETCFRHSSIFFVDLMIVMIRNDCRRWSCCCEIDVLQDQVWHSKRTDRETSLKTVKLPAGTRTVRCVVQNWQKRVSQRVSCEILLPFSFIVIKTLVIFHSGKFASQKSRRCIRISIKHKKLNYIIKNMKNSIIAYNWSLRPSESWSVPNGFCGESIGNILGSKVSIGCWRLGL